MQFTSPHDNPGAKCPIAVPFDHHSTDLDETTLWPIYQTLLNEAPVAYSEAHGGFWTISRYADVKAALRDHKTFSSASGHRIPFVDSMASIPIDYDPPEHTAYRPLLAQALSPQVVREMEPFLRRVIAQYVAHFAEAGGGEAISAIALPIPLRVLRQLVGFSEATVAQFRTMTENIWADGTAESQVRGRIALGELLDHDIAQHREHTPHDYLTWLLKAQVGDRAIRDDEVTSVLTTLAVAGHETTLNSIGTLLYLLACDSTLQDRLRQNRSEVAAYVEEMLRLRTPAQMFARRTTRDVVVGGITIPRGDWVLLINAAANRDPRRFDNPDSFDTSRSAHGHLAFGWGVHQCVGSALARSELTILLQTLCEYPRFTLAGAPTFSTITAGTHYGPKTLPLQFEDRDQKMATAFATTNQ
jgi:cytochrome P450